MLEGIHVLPPIFDHDEMLVLHLNRSGTIKQVSRAVTRLLNDGLVVGQSLQDGCMLLSAEQLSALLACQSTWTGRTTLLRGEAPPIAATLLVMPYAEALVVMLSVNVGELVQLQEELGSINSQLTNLNRERVKAKARLERAMLEVEEKNGQLERANSVLEVRTQALHQAQSDAEALAQENRELHQLHELKNQFIGIISHELKTPLNFIMGFGSVLADGVLGALSAPQSEAMDQVLSGAERLDTLINELLDSNKLQAGKLDVSPTWVALPALIATLLDEMAPLVARQGLRLTPPTDCPATVWADPDRLHQVLRNLLSNAIKFTPEGGAVALTTESCDGPAGPMVRVRVSDTGIGISGDLHRRLFEPFYQVNSTSTREYGGTGLGLSIVKSLIELMGGEVGVESIQGQGACFWFTLPLAPVSPQLALGDVG